MTALAPAIGSVDPAAPRYARAAGAGYLLIILTGIFAEFVVRAGLIVPGDAAATAVNIAASESLFRLAIAAEFVMLTSDIMVALALYVVFKHVNAHLALLAAFFRLAHAAIVAVNLLNTYVPLVLLDGSGPAGSLDAAQRSGLTAVFLDAHGYGYAVGLVFFAAHCGVLGYMVVRSSFAPRILGILLMLAAAGYLTDSFARTLVPAYGAYETAFALAVFLPAFVAELAFCMWLLVRGGRPRPDRAPTLAGAQGPATPPAPTVTDS